MSRFLEITCPKEQARYRQAGMLWLRDGYDPTDEYSQCSVSSNNSPLEAVEYQKEMIDCGWKYAILIEEDDGGDD